VALRMPRPRRPQPVIDPQLEWLQQPPAAPQDDEPGDYIGPDEGLHCGAADQPRNAVGGPRVARRLRCRARHWLGEIGLRIGPRYRDPRREPLIAAGDPGRVVILRPRTCTERTRGDDRPSIASIAPGGRPKRRGTGAGIGPGLAGPWTDSDVAAGD